FGGNGATLPAMPVAAPVAVVAVEEVVIVVAMRDLRCGLLLVLVGLVDDDTDRRGAQQQCQKAAVLVVHRGSRGRKDGAQGQRGSDESGGQSRGQLAEHHGSP